MSSLDPSPLLSALVSQENAHQVLGALQVEVPRLNNTLNLYKTSVDQRLFAHKGSVDFEVSSLTGEVKTVKDGVSDLSEKVKFEIIKTNGIMDQVADRVKQLGESGGVIQQTIEQLVTRVLLAINDTVNKGKNDMQVVKLKVKNIEDMISANSGAIPSQTFSHRNQKVLLEYHVINSLQIMASDKSTYKEWNDKLVSQRHRTVPSVC